MDRVLKETFLTKLDEVLASIGFKRSKTSQEWKRKSGKSDIEWIHLNMGLAEINPSFGVTYKDLANVLPKESGFVNSVSIMFTSVTGEQYDENTSPIYLAKQVVDLVPPELEKLKNRDWVVEQLQSDKIVSWPVCSLSHRIRLLPLLLGEKGLVEKAIHYAEEFEKKYSSQDQILPSYKVFINYLIEHYNA
jgi:hypothetical protein